MRQRESSVCLAYVKNDGGWFIFDAAEYPRLKEEWIAARGGVFEGRGFYGAELVVKLGEINGISLTTPEAQRAKLEDDAANEREDSMGH